MEVSGGELLLLTAGPLHPPPHTLTTTCTTLALHRMSVEVSPEKKEVELLLPTAGPPLFLLHTLITALLPLTLPLTGCQWKHQGLSCCC